MDKLLSTPVSGSSSTIFSSFHNGNLYFSSKINLSPTKTHFSKWVPKLFSRILFKSQFELKSSNGYPLNAVSLQDEGSAANALAEEINFPESGKRDSTLSITVVGASGDLAKKKIFPALFALYYEDCLPENFVIFGYSRTKMNDEELRNMISRTLTCRVDKRENCDDKMMQFLKRCFYHSGQYNSEEHFLELNSKLKEKEGGKISNRLFYLSIPPNIFVDVVRCASTKASSTTGWTRVIVEKPFGRDAESSSELTRRLKEYLTEDQIFRIDHYLGKELVENLSVLRFSNLVFEPLWSRNYIRNVQFIFSEDFGTEGRGGYFDNYGIIRDIMQNHLLQILALFAMETPVSLDAEDIRNEKVKVLRSMRPLQLEDVVVGQYKGHSKGNKSYPGYTDDPTVPTNSITPTFAAAALFINNARWDGVPFLMKAGKALHTKRAEIRVQFRHVPGNLYKRNFGADMDKATNELVLRVQPDEAIYLKVNNKVPGLGMRLDRSDLNLLYKARFSSFCKNSLRMGRSCAAATAHPAAAEARSQSRSRRKRATQSVDTNETVTPVPGIAYGKKALYHCNYCNKDISGKIRIKCAICSDFDLCVECFSVGAEVYPHKSFHPYRVMDNLAFPLICEDWNADEEMLLLEGLEMYGICNWNEVAIHVATKGKVECIDHFNKIYLNSTCFPLPDMSRVMGKNREELLAMAREPSEIKKDIGTAEGSGSDKMSTKAGKRAFSIMGTDDLDTIKVEDMSIGAKKEISMKELSGYNSKRHEFEIEYDNDAEQLLADMEFKETDTAVEHELKVRVLRIYSKRLSERNRRKDFIIERNLLHPDPFEKNLTLEEKELCDRYRVFMRFHSKEEHHELLRTLVEQQRILRRIKNLQEARSAGCRTMADCERYIEQKMKRVIEESHQIMETSQASPGGRYLQRVNPRKGEQELSSRGSNMSHTVLDNGGNDSSSVHKIYGSGDSENWDVTGFVGSELLSEADKKLCGEIRILPTHYLKMQETMTKGILNGNLTKKSDAYVLFNVDPAKVDKIYDMLIKKGIARA